MQLSLLYGPSAFHRRLFSWSCVGGNISTLVAVPLPGVLAEALLALRWQLRPPWISEPYVNLTFVVGSIPAYCVTRQNRRPVRTVRTVCRCERRLAPLQRRRPARAERPPKPKRPPRPKRPLRLIWPEWYSPRSRTRSLFGLWRSLVSALVWGTRGRRFKSGQPDDRLLRRT